MASPIEERQARRDLITQLETARDSRVLVYVCGDRQNATAQISDDAVRPMYDHVRKIGHVKRLDLFLYSRGGSVEVPWRIVTMLREHCDHLTVLVPYKAHSAATLIALGCDEIVMGDKAELGPIDPAVDRKHIQEGVEVQEEVRVEDVMAYVNFATDKNSEQNESTRQRLFDTQLRTQRVQLMAEHLTPTFLGHIYRTHTHIRMVAALMLGCRGTALSEDARAKIISALAEKIPSHGHAVGRREAKDIGLPVAPTNPEIEGLMWRLMESYEQAMHLLVPVDPETMLDEAGGSDELESDLALAMIETADLTTTFKGRMKVKRVRQIPQTLNLNFNLNLSLPPGVDVNNLAPNAQAILQALVQQAQQAAADAANKAVREQCPVARVEGRMRGAMWRHED